MAQAQGHVIAQTRALPSDLPHKLLPALCSRCILGTLAMQPATWAAVLYLVTPAKDRMHTPWAKTCQHAFKAVSCESAVQDPAMRPSFGEVCPALRKLLEQEVEHRRRCPPAQCPIAAPLSDSRIRSSDF